jgi:nicotinate-nucleotide adenylyltransferase
MQDAARLASHPRMHVTGLEAKLNIRYTADLADRLRRRVPHVRFVWIMGSDNLANFHRWERWRDIADNLPMLIINRPGSLTAQLGSPAATALSAYRIGMAAAPGLAGRQPPAWSYLVCPRTDVSSTVIRERGGKMS